MYRFLHPRRKYHLVALGTIVIAAATAWLWLSPLGEHIRSGNLDDLVLYLRSFGWIAILIGIAAIGLQTVFPVVPYLILAGANVLVFGLYYGFLINWLGALLGATLTFILVRKWGRNWAQRKWKDQKQVQWFNERLDRQGFWILLLVRVFPIVPPTLVNVLAGLSRIRFSTYLLATMIGKIPAVWIGSLISHDLIHFEEYKGRITLVAVVLLALSGIGYYVKIYVSRNKSS
jgi:uncharacterized membrane protein YdjX (TVP38/TMEM64 family)